MPGTPGCSPRTSATLEEWGGDRIRRALASRGIDRELVEDAIVGDGDEPTSELERALEMLRRRFPSAAQERRERDRALGVLLRKGYELDLALDALARHGSDVNVPPNRCA